MSAITERRKYLRRLAHLIDKARELADELPRDDGWGGGLPLTDRTFGYGNTSDLLSDLAATVRNAADASDGSRKHATKKSMGEAQLDGEIQAILDYSKAGKPGDIERWVDDWLRENRGKDWARPMFAKHYVKAIRSR